VVDRRASGAQVALVAALMVGALQGRMAHAQEPFGQGTQGSSKTNEPEVTTMADESVLFHIGSRRELFVDDQLVAERENVELVINPGEKHPGNPLLRVEKPWEGWRIYLYGSVIFDDDDDLFKMWYIAVGSGAVTCYATSTDGIHWERPALNLPAFKKYGQDNNIVGKFHMANVMKDTRDPIPARRWKMICWHPRYRPGLDPRNKRWEDRWGYCTMISADGIRWEHHSPGPIAYVDGGGDVITCCYDETREQYIALLKVHQRAAGRTRRCFALTTSIDFDTWSTPEMVLATDEIDDASIGSRLDAARPILFAPDEPKNLRADFYGIGLLPTPSVTIAFPWVLWINNASLWGRKKQDGVKTVQLAASRDLRNWDRCADRRQIIRQGTARKPPNADWDSGSISTATRPVIHDDKVWLYYGGHNITHGHRALYVADDPRRGKEATGAIGLVTWRLDGFMSADAGSHPGHLTTKPLTFEGDRLVVNVHAPNGRFTAELLASDGAALPGFDKTRCDPFTGDAIRHTVTWGGRSSVSQHQGKPVRVRFHLRNAKLYAYTFVSGQ